MVVIHQIVIVVTEPRRCTAVGRVGRIGIGRRHLILPVHRLFHWVLLFQVLQILMHGVMDLGFGRGQVTVSGGQFRGSERGEGEPHSTRAVGGSRCSPALASGKDGRQNRWPPTRPTGMGSSYSGWRIGTSFRICAPATASTERGVHSSVPSVSLTNRNTIAISALRVNL